MYQLMMGQKIENEIVQDYTKLAPVLRSFSFIEGRNLIRIKNESVEKRYNFSASC
jgi:hypothetical protein